MTTYASRLKSYPVTPAATVVVKEGDTGADVVNGSTLALLTICSARRSLQDHATIASRLLGKDRENVRYQLERLVEAGYIRDEGPSSHQDPGVTPISVLSIVSADRPTVLARALESYVRHCVSHDNPVRIAVADGSRMAASATKAIVQAAVRAHERPISYWGDDARATVVAALIDSGVPKRVASFALASDNPGATTVGAVRNLVILLTAGKKILTADDDTLCTPWAHPARDTNRVVFVGHNDVRNVGVFESRDAALDGLSWCNESLLSAHERLLGRSPFDIFAEWRDGSDFVEPCMRLLAAISQTQPGGRVRTTVSGIAGDNGQSCGFRSMLTDGQFRQELSRSRVMFQVATSSREVRRIARAPTIGHVVSSMLYCSGIDNSAVVPPFLPMGRNEDGLFGRIARLCNPDTFTGHVALGIVHDTERPSTYGGGLVESASTTRVSDILIGVLSYMVTSNPTQAWDLKSVGNALCDFARQDLAIFVRELNSAMLTMRCAEFRELEEWTRERTECAPHWKAGVMRLRETFLSCVREPGMFLPSELDPAGIHGVAAFTMLQRFLENYGELLCWWPEMWSAAARFASTEELD